MTKTHINRSEHAKEDRYKVYFGDSLSGSASCDFWYFSNIFGYIRDISGICCKPFLVGYFLNIFNFRVLLWSCYLCRWIPAKLAALHVTLGAGGGEDVKMDLELELKKVSSWVEKPGSPFHGYLVTHSMAITSNKIWISWDIIWCFIGYCDIYIMEYMDGAWWQKPRSNLAKTGDFERWLTWHQFWLPQRFGCPKMGSDFQ